MRFYKLEGLAIFGLDSLDSLPLVDGSMGVKINEMENDFFLTGKGLRQGVLYPMVCLILWLMCSRKCFSKEAGRG
jgi:hypothetical protein